jgi:U6 snRNA-associated Sm-like protein LSm8
MSSLGPFVGSKSPPVSRAVFCPSGANSPSKETVTILTSDGRTLTGQLLGHDQTTNLILSGTVERIFSLPESDEATQEVEHGLYLIRGDNVAICGLVDESVENGIDWTAVKAHPLGGMKHS